MKKIKVFAFFCFFLFALQFGTISAEADEPVPYAVIKAADVSVEFGSRIVLSYTLGENNLTDDQEICDVFYRVFDADGFVIDITDVVPVGNYTIEIIGASLYETVLGLPIEECNLRFQQGTLSVLEPSPVVKSEITIKAKDRTAEYSGYMVTANDYIVSGNLSDGDFISEIKYTGGSVLVTNEAVESRPHGAVILNQSGVDVTDSYEITYSPGKVWVTPCDDEAIIIANSNTKVYDGTALIDEGYTYSGFKASDRVIAKAGGSVTAPSDIGINRIITSGADACRIVNAEGYDVTDCYNNVRLVDGKLTVEKRPVSLTVGNREKIYDGKIFYVQDSKLTFSSGELVEGHSLIARYSARQNGINVNAVDAGVYSLVAYECFIVDKIGLDVSDCYDIKIKPGTLTIKSVAKAIPVTITAGSQTWTYDGSSHSYNEYVCEGLVDGDTIADINFSGESKITAAGTVDNIITSVIIVSSNGRIVENGKYDVSFIPGKLIVEKFPLMLIAVSDSKVYDGKALVNLHLQANELANTSHTLKVEFGVFDKDGKETDAIEVGTYEKRITGYTINNGADDVCYNYDVKLVNGTLTVIDAFGDAEPHSPEKPATGRWLSIVVASILLAGILGYMYFRNRKVNKAK